jgi:hypothetical protein
MIRISWLLVSYLAAAIVIFAGPDQPEQAIDTERSSLTVHVGKAGLLSGAAPNTGSTRQSQAERLPPTAPSPPCGSPSMLAGFSVSPEKGVTDKDRAEVQCNPTCRPGFWTHMLIQTSFSDQPRSGESAALYGECLAT